jgi:2-C-methyl-D-erythritol 4-phosphate cytidylyltransferase
MKRVTAIIVAAGQGRRFGSPKQFALLRGRSVLDWSLAVFGQHPRITDIILVLPDEALGKKFTRAHPKLRAVVRGGAERQDSVFRGFSELDPRRAEIVLIHDGARPLVSSALIRRVIREAEKHGACVPGVPLEDTVKRVDGGLVVRTLDRAKLSRIQTPQGFSYGLLKRAFARAWAEKFYGTDDASLVERLGEKVVVTEGDPKNIKVTTLLDLKLAEVHLED